MSSTHPRLVVLVSCAILVGSLLGAGPATAEPTAPKAAAAPSVDLSGAMPSAARNELSYDFLNRGYEQRLIAEDDKLNLYEPPARGGQRISSTDLDLVAPPMQANRGLGFDNVYDVFTDPGDPTSCQGCLQQRATDYGLNAVYLAVLGDSLYITGTKGGTTNGPPFYQNLLYKAPLSLTCATQACLGSANVQSLPNDYLDQDEGERYTIAATSLAAGFAGGNPYVAVGLTGYGVAVFDANLRQVSSYTGMASGKLQTPVIALAFDPWGSGTVAVGTMQAGTQGYFFTLAADGSIPSGHRWNFWGGPDVRTIPLSVAFGRRADGSLVAGYGVSGGVDGYPASLFLADPTSPDNALPMTSLAVPGTGVTTVRSLPRIDGSTGLDDFAVYSNSGFGSLIRYDQPTNAMSFLPLQPAGGDPANGTATQLPTDTWRSWFPGYKTGRLVVTNGGSEPVQVDLQSRPDPQYGCWYDPAYASSDTFPTAGLTLAPGQSSDAYTMGGLTAGPQGLCGASDATGAWRGYLVVTPAIRNADARIVNVQLERQGLTLDLSDQAGGATTVTAPASPTRGIGLGAFGAWTLTLGMPAAPTPQVAPTIVKARQITTSSRSRVPVYRFDVGPTSWTVPGAAASAAQPQVQAVLPPLQVQGSVDGQDWSDLGSLLPIGPLTRSGTTVTTSGASFWWENPLRQIQYKQLRVVAGSLASAPIVLQTLATPAAPATAISGLQLTATKTNSDTMNLVPSGLDQGQVQVVINDANGNQLPANDASYDTVYYRDPGNNLITNLWDPSGAYLGVQPVAGAYPNDGTTPRSRRPLATGNAYDYMTTTIESLVPVTGWVGLGAPTATNSDRIKVDDQADNIEYGSGSGSAGFSLDGCSDFSNSPGGTCAIAPATSTRPAPYQAGADGGPPALGVQLVNTGQNAAADLPLAWKGGADRQLLANATLNLVNQSALIKLTNTTSFRPSNSVDVTLVSHGRSVPVTVPLS